MTLDRLALEDIESSQNEVVVESRKVTQTLKKGLSGQSKRKESLRRGPAIDDTVVAATAWTGETLKNEETRGVHTEIRDRTERRRSRRRFWNVMLIWFIPLVFISALAAAAYFYRQNIVDRLPESASLYKAFGIEVSAPGLTLTPPVTHYVQLDGKPVLIVEGEVRNISSEALTVPLVTLTLHNSSGQQVAEWNVELETARLEAGAAAPYLTQYPAPPLDADELRSRFANELEGMSTPIEVSAPQNN